MLHWKNLSMARLQAVGWENPICFRYDILTGSVIYRLLLDFYMTKMGEALYCFIQQRLVWQLYWLQYPWPSLLDYMLRWWICVVICTWICIFVFVWVSKSALLSGTKNLGFRWLPQGSGFESLSPCQRFCLIQPCFAHAGCDRKGNCDQVIRLGGSPSTVRTSNGLGGEAVGDVKIVFVGKTG